MVPMHPGVDPSYGHGYSYGPMAYYPDDGGGYDYGYSVPHGHVVPHHGGYAPPAGPYSTGSGWPADAGRASMGMPEPLPWDGLRYRGDMDFQPAAAAVAPQRQFASSLGTHTP